MTRLTVHLLNCTRRPEERTQREILFRDALLNMACPEQILELRNSFLLSTEQGRRGHEYQRLYQSAFWNAAHHTERKENKQWKFRLEIK